MFYSTACVLTVTSTIYTVQESHQGLTDYICGQYMKKIIMIQRLIISLSNVMIKCDGRDNSEINKRNFSIEISNADVKEKLGYEYKTIFITYTTNMLLIKKHVRTCALLFKPESCHKSLLLFPARSLKTIYSDHFP